jgi:hypothetical protein
MALRDTAAKELGTLSGEMERLRQDAAADSGAVADERIAAAVSSQLEARVTAVEARLRGEVLEAADRSSAQAADASATRLGEQLAPVQAALAEKDREIAELRRRLVDNEETVLELVLALGRMRRHKATRSTGATPAEAASHDGPPPDDSGPSAGTPTGPAAGPPAAPEPPPPPPPSAAPLAPFRTVAAAPRAEIKGRTRMEPTPIAPACGPSRWWQIPLVT